MLSSRVVSFAIVAVVLGMGASGCASVPRSATTEPPQTTAPSDPADAVVSIPMPDLGPSPAPDPFTPEMQEAARLADRDSAWQGVLAQYPSAVRPEVAFEGYVTAETSVAVLSACYEAAGVAYDRGRDSPDMSSPVTSVGALPVSEEQAVAAYACAAAHPRERAWSPPNEAQLGYIYDYLTEFIVPCYEANGIVNPDPPTRENFVAQWPNQGWFPNTSPDGRVLEPEVDDALDEACPMTN